MHKYYLQPIEKQILGTFVSLLLPSSIVYKKKLVSSPIVFC
ncbi:hypothetical protein LSO9J_160006 [Candidatus Liberibacter solanacearum]